MKKLSIAALLLFCTALNAQSTPELKKHFEAFYKQMKQQGDVNGAINALTHLIVLEPSAARKDTLAYLYANAGQYLQAVNVLGAEKKESDTDLAVEIKAISLKQLNQPQLAVQQYELLHSRKPDVYTAYELVDLNLQIGKAPEAKKYLDYGLANVKDDQMLPFYESNPPYQVPLKAAFTYQKGLLQYNENKTNIDAAAKTIDEAILMAPNFTLAKQIKELLLKQKESAGKPQEKKQ